MIKNIIFDLDGVLFDGCDLHARLFIEAVAIIRSDIVLTKEYHYIALNALSTSKKLAVLNITGKDAESIFKIKQDLTQEYIMNSVYPDKKNKELCKRLISLDYKLYCVTNSIRSTVESILTRQGIIELFTGIISNQDVLEPKPSPQPYLTLYSKYTLNANECLIVEDSPRGIESAIKSGGNVLRVRDCNDVTVDVILNTIIKVNSGENINVNCLN